MSASTVALVAALCRDRPVLAPLLTEHRADNDGEVLPHLLLSDVVRWLASRCDSHWEEAEQVWAYLSRAYLDGDEEVKDLVVVSGVENIPDPGQRGAELRTLLDPVLRQFDPWRWWTERTPDPGV